MTLSRRMAATLAKAPRRWRDLPLSRRRDEIGLLPAEGLGGWRTLEALERRRLILMRVCLRRSCFQWRRR